jgi:hypothetical protein
MNGHCWCGKPYPCLDHYTDYARQPRTAGGAR